MTLLAASYMEAGVGLPFLANVAADRAELASGNALVVCHGQLAAPISPMALRVLTLFANDLPLACHAKVVTPRDLRLCAASVLVTRFLARMCTKVAVAFLLLDTLPNVSSVLPQSLPFVPKEELSTQNSRDLIHQQLISALSCLCSESQVKKQRIGAYDTPCSSSDMSPTASPAPLFSDAPAWKRSCDNSSDSPDTTVRNCTNLAAPSSSAYK